MPKVVAVVPTFRPTPDVVDRILKLRRQVDELIIVDDGSGEGPGSGFEIVSALETKGITTIRLPENRGIATALNRGISRALESGADYVLNVDQDTDLPDDYVEVALSTFANANRVTRLGLVCVDRVNGDPALPTWTSPEGLGLVPEAIQTGFLIKRECLEVAGLMDERLVIDTVDTEYCLRVRDHGFAIAIATGTNVQHSIGARAPYRPFGIAIKSSNGTVKTYQYHSPLRRYYIARNNIDLMFRNLKKRPRWVLSVAKREARGMVYSIVSGPRRTAQFIAISTGTVHGLIRRRGIIPAWLRKLIQ